MSIVRQTAYIGAIDKISDYETLVETPGIHIHRVATYSGARDIAGRRGPFTISATLMSTMESVSVTDGSSTVYIPLRKCLTLTWWKLHHIVDYSYKFHHALGSTATGFPGPQYNGNVETTDSRGPVFSNDAYRWTISDTIKNPHDRGYLTKLYFTFAKYSDFDEKDFGQYSAQLTWFGHDSNGDVITTNGVDQNLIPQNTIVQGVGVCPFVKPSSTANITTSGFVQIPKGEEDIPDSATAEYVAGGGG